MVSLPISFTIVFTLLLCSFGGHALPLPYHWTSLQPRENSDSPCGLKLRDGEHTRMCVKNNLSGKAFRFDARGNFGFGPITTVTDAYHCDHVLELNMLNTLMKRGADALHVTTDGLCQHMATLTKDGKPFGLAQKIKDIVEGQQNLLYMPAAVNTGKYQMMAGNGLDSVAFRTRPAVASVLRKRQRVIYSTADQIAALLVTPTSTSATDITQIPNNPFPNLTSDWKEEIVQIVEKITKKYPEPKRMASCTSDSQSSSDDNPLDITYKGDNQEVPESHRETRSKATKTGKRAEADECLAEESSTSSHSTSTSRAPSNRTASLVSSISGVHSSAALSRTSLAPSTSTLRSGITPSGVRVSGEAGTTMRVLPSAAPSAVLSSPSSRLQAPVLATGAPASRSGKPAATGALPAAVGATTRPALPPVRNVPVQGPAATPKPQLAPSTKLPVPIKPLSGTVPKGASPRVAKFSKLSPFSRL